MIPRIGIKKIKQLARQFRVVAVVGPRQSGKTTICRQAFPKKPMYPWKTPIMNCPLAHTPCIETVHFCFDDFLNNTLSNNQK
jgi:predicted AAA+ superfamily ATPase